MSKQNGHWTQELSNLFTYLSPGVDFDIKLYLGMTFFNDNIQDHRVT